MAGLLHTEGNTVRGTDEVREAQGRRQKLLPQLDKEKALGITEGLFHNASCWDLNPGACQSIDYFKGNVIDLRSVPTITFPL